MITYVTANRMELELYSGDELVVRSADPYFLAHVADKVGGMSNTVMRSPFEVWTEEAEVLFWKLCKLV